MKQRLLGHWLGLLLLSVCAIPLLRAQQIEGHRLISWADASGAIKIPDGVTELADNALKGNSAITHIDFNEVRIIGVEACANLSQLSGISAPNVEELKAKAFYQSGNKFPAKSIVELFFPKCKQVGEQALRLNDRIRIPLSTIALPVVEVLAVNIFGGTSIEVLDLSRAPLAGVTPKAWRAVNHVIVADEAKKKSLKVWDTRGNYLLASALPSTEGEPSLSLSVHIARGAPISLESLRLGASTANAILAMDLGDGQVRYKVAANKNAAYYDYKLGTLRSLRDNPTIKCYGTIEKIFLSEGLLHISGVKLSETLLSKLEDLTLWSDAIVPTSLANAVQLKNLSIRLKGNTDITQLDLGKLSQLQELSLSGFEALEQLSLAPIATLSKINVFGSPKLKQVPWKPLESAQAISVSGCGLSGKIDLTAFKALETLDLSRNHIDSLVLSSNVLTSFDCRGNNLRSIELASTPTDLASVTVYKNRLSASNLNTLYEKLTDRKDKEAGKLYVLETATALPSVDNDAFAAKRELLLQKNWTAVDANGKEFTEMIVRGDTLVSWNTASGDIVIPDNVRVIAPHVFYENDKVTSITGSGVEYIGNIYNVPNLTSLHFPNFKDFIQDKYWDENELEYADILSYTKGDGDVDVTLSHRKPRKYIDETPRLGLLVLNGRLLYVPKDLSGELHLPNEVTTIVSGALWGCNKITKIRGTNVKEIKYLAFGHCSALTEVDFPKLESTQGEVSAYCDKLQEVKNSKGIWVWKNATGTVVIPEGTEVIGPYAFFNNTKLTGIQWPKTLKRIGRSAFGQTKVTEAIIPEGVESVGAFAFYGTPITKARVPESVRRTGRQVFNECNQLVELEWLARDPSLPYAFVGSSALKRLTIGKHILGFWGHHNYFWEPNYTLEPIMKVAKNQLDELICYSPELIWLGVFGDRLKYAKKLYVLAGLVNAYEKYKARYLPEGDTCEILPISGTEGDKQITLTEHADYKVYVREAGGGQRQIQSGERLPAGTDLVAYVLPEPGKVVTAIRINGNQYDQKNWHQFLLAEDVTISATVEAIDISQYEELYSVDYEGRQGQLQVETIYLKYKKSGGFGFYPTYPISSRLPKVLIDLGGGRYAYSGIYSYAVDIMSWVDTPRFIYGEDNPKMRYYFRKEYLTEPGKEVKLDHDVFYEVNIYSQYKGFQAHRPDLCISVEVTPRFPNCLRGVLVPLPNLSGMTNLSEIRLSSECMKMTSCRLNDFYSNLPTRSNASIDIFRGETHPAVQGSDISIATAKGWKFYSDIDHKHEITSTPGGGCKDAYALKVASNVPGMTYKYIEDKVEKPLPTSVPRGKAVQIIAQYDRERYNDPSISFAEAPDTYGSGWSDEHQGYSVSFTVEQDIDLSFAFRKRTYALTLPTVEHATLSIKGNPDLSRIEYGTELELEVVPDAGYEVEEVRIAGVVKQAPYRFVVKTTVHIEVRIRQSSGVEAIEAQLERIYPNPATTYIVIERAEVGSELRILTLEGIEVWRERIKCAEQRIGIGTLASGIYLVQVGGRSYRLVVAR